MNRWNLLPCLGLLLLPHSIPAAAIVLDVPEVIQEQTEWCWAGTTNAVLRYYKTPLKQCEIANFTRTSNPGFHDFGSEDCCRSPAGACNYWNYNWGQAGSMQEILRKWGVDNKGVSKSLAISQARSELESKRPFIVRWAYKTSGGHFVVGHGLTDSSLHYMDPWPGEGLKIATYAWVVSNARKDWDGTNVMLTSPVSSANLPAERAGLSIRGRMSNSGMTLTYELADGSAVHIQLRSLQGKVLHEFHRAFQPAGTHQASFRATALPPGAYVLSIQADEQSATTIVLAGP